MRLNEPERDVGKLREKIPELTAFAGALRTKGGREAGLGGVLSFPRVISGDPDPVGPEVHLSALAEFYLNGIPSLPPHIKMGGDLYVLLVQSQGQQLKQPTPGEMVVAEPEAGW
ncbi:hypothetical protein chiPu_0011140 [Chiloscyllium punctatum]|uniref:Uncharacterized protein n=1 Tax=Chiloscyllium punctatum TaxID=137246 RepID=A0A401SQN3_CHIPU|nr:hypothetical protein [Chiloscyllium punctatum]